MKLFRVIIPNLTVSLALAVAVVMYVDNRNPMMGFLSGTPAVVLLASLCVCSLITAFVYLGSHKR